MYGPIGHGFGGLAAVFAAIVWSIGVFVLLLIVIALAVLLARFLWVGTKVAQRYLELNGSPAPRPRMTAPAATTPTASSAPAAAPTTTTTAPRTTPAANTTAPNTTAPTKPLPKPRTPKPPAA